MTVVEAEPTTDFWEGREEVLGALRAELLGPDPVGTALSLSEPPRFDSREASYGPWVEKDTSEEILQRDRPTKRYGVGVLYPRNTESFDASLEASEDDPIPGVSDKIATIAPVSTDRPDANRPGVAEDDDFDLSDALTYRPSAMAISFLGKLPADSQLRITASGGRYESFEVDVSGSPRSWWVRRPVSMVWMMSAKQILFPETTHRVNAELVSATNVEGLDLRVEGLVRPRGGDESLVTVSLVNRTENQASVDANSLFQSRLTAEVVSRSGERFNAIAPYPDQRTDSALAADPEERSMRLLYRNAPTFGVGHGCAATWDAAWGARAVGSVTGDPLPEYETPSITPDIVIGEGAGATKLEVPMAPLGGLISGNDGLGQCHRVIDEYEKWLSAQATKAESLSGTDAAAAQDHLESAGRVLARMKEGLEWLESDGDALRAFQLANRAILEQQLRAGPLRETTATREGFYRIEGFPPNMDIEQSPARGNWRAFQIAFLLQAVRSTVIADDQNRETVDLIFFPTGGGKTEAYLGLAAFALFHQRLTRPSQVGVGVLMRYTLRLLTAQQFLRAASLICAMESIRREESMPGPTFSIGIWVGQSATPVWRNKARSALRELRKYPRSQNPFLLLRCPWCRAQMGPVRAEKGAPSLLKIAGYSERGGTIAFHCPDRDCQFSALLPVFVIDEDVYENRPSIVIGTVDKFAMLTWRPEARTLFGLDPGGNRALDPPNLIIQDELHLISGPLGSMVGHYETLIEELCTDRRQSEPLRPKIVGSTATIRRYGEQVLRLYARSHVDLFPPHGLDASDSFFARYARDLETGQLLPGRKYVGVHAPGLGSIQTAQVRTMSSLLQAAGDLPKAERDPWWTLMVFFNSLRELGTSVSLLQSDIPDYLAALKNRRGIPWSQVRRLRNVKELTGRLRQDEIPQAMDDLERTATSRWPVDVCVASNIIEVGIDIGRLSVMCIVGQPKSTSQYIQVTGRVGRNWKERPGLIVTIYGASKPRDRSHFEQFQAYHSRLYAQVEPVSVTPFSPPVLERASHAVLAGYVRQFGPEGIRPWPMPMTQITEAIELLVRRVRVVDPAEEATLLELIDRRLDEWQRWSRSDWQAKMSSTNTPAPLFRRFGQWLPPGLKRQTWATPTSMRDVDAECQAEITTLYQLPGNDS